MLAVVWDTKLILALIILAMLGTIAEVYISNEPLRVISSESVLSKVKAGLPIEYDHVIIKGDLVLIGLGLPTKYVDRAPMETNLGLSENVTIINSSIRINDSIIDGRIELNNSIFQKSVSFENTKFYDSVYFKGSQFSESANFKGARFSGFVDFRGTKFRKFVDLSGASFNKSVDFLGSEFNRPDLLSSLRFNETVNFAESKLSEFSNFIGSKFYEITSLVELQSIRFVDFIGPKCQEIIGSTESQLIEFVDFIRPKYHEIAGLIESKLIGFFDLIVSECRETASFIESRSIGFPDFIRSKFNETYQFAAWIFHNPNIMLKYLLECSAVFIVVFAFFWRLIGLKSPNKPDDESNFLEDQRHNRSSLWSIIKNESVEMIESFRFSTMVFLSGTKIFIDTPNAPELPGRLRYLTGGMFTVERVIGAMISILIFVAIGRLQ